MSTELATVPLNIELPAHLRTPEAAAEIAAANAAAAGGIKAGGFPSISIEAGKFHIKEGGELTTLMHPAVGTQPALPMMCLEIVVLDANPVLSKTYFKDEFVKGGPIKEPDCRSSNGVTPDAGVPNKQADVCVTCPMNQWGSKISKLSGKDIKACDDSKQLAIVPAADLAFKALGLQVHKGSLKNWGAYVNELNGRGFPITGLVTNVTFDATATGVLRFDFGRFLTPEQSAQVKDRAAGQDVKTIVAQTRTIAPALPAPAATALLPGVVTAAAAPVPAAPPPPPAPAPAPAPAQTGFGATQPASPPAAATPPAEAPKRTRRTREQIEADKAAAGGAPVNDPALTHLPPAILAAVLTVGKDSPAGQAMLAQFPAPAAPAAPADPFAGQPAHVKPAVEAAGGLGSPGGDAVFAALKVVPATAAPVLNPAPIVATPTAPAGGFGGAVVQPAPVVQPSAAVTDAAAALKAKLEALLKPKAA